MKYLRQATASQSRSIGPFLDSTDFVTAKTALTIANTDIKLMANGGASANKNSGGGTHRVNGFYGVTFDATDTATVGELKVSVVVAGALPVFDTFTVLEEPVYDALFAASAAGYGTAQTGDSFARLGAPAGASVSADVAAVKAQTAAIETDTQDIQGRIPAALTAGGNIKADTLALSGSTTAADNLESGATALVVSTCAAGSTTTSVVTNLTEATNDHYNGRVITFTSGALAGQTTSISAYNGTTKALTVVAMTEAPADTDAFVIS